MVSWWWDYLVILAWLIITGLVFGLLNAVGWVDSAEVWSRPLARDLTLMAMTVVPYLVYLVITESGPAHATWGKRRTHLAVESTDGSVPQPRRIVVRNLVKVLPWQVAHIAAIRYATNTQLGVAAAFFWMSQILLISIAGPPLVGRRGLHDRIAGTRVRPASRPDGA